MSSAVTRRGFLGATVAGGTAVGLVPLLGSEPASAATGKAVGPGIPTEPGPVTVGTADARYGYLNTRGLNKRFSGTPAEIFPVFGTDQVVSAVNTAVAGGLQIAARSGGHCLDGLVDNSSVGALIDVAQMNAVYFDSMMDAFCVESGAQLGDVYKQLQMGYGVVVPGGTCPTVGMGGYVQGGGFGALCRRDGLIVDHLYGIEVVTVNSSGRAQAIVATRDPSDPNYNLWWAHTGSGGGNFGVVTRYWFRSPDATGAAPSQLLPTPPASVIVATVTWPWSSMTEAAFSTLVANHGAWHAANSVYGSPYDSLYSAITYNSYASGRIALIAEIDATIPNAAALMNDYIAAVNAGVTAPSTTQQSTMPWLSAIYSYLYGGAPTPYNRDKGKGAFLRKPFSASQISTMYQYLSDPTFPGLGTVTVFSYGSKINTVAPSATVAAQRDSIMKAYIGSAWSDPTKDSVNLAWVRALYQQMYAATGGVPVTGGDTDGSYINYPDVDLADPAWNTSGQPWSTLYFKDNYPRLQQIKAQYDPANVFRHPLSVQLPS